jgi:hypothetical protein
VVSSGLSALVSKLAVAQPSSEEPLNDSAVAVSESTGKAPRETGGKIQTEFSPLHVSMKRPGPRGSTRD